jgi:large subunit ribosomal protein L2
MAIKVYKPTTPGRRKMSVSDYSMLTKKSKVPKRLLLGKARSGGRNASGKITVRHIGGGFKKKLRLLDKKRDKYDVPGKIASIEYDPGHSAFISLVVYRDGDKRLILAPAGVKVGQTIVASKKKVEVEPGNRTMLKFVPAGTLVHDIEIMPGRGGQIARSAGTYATVTGTEGEYVLLKLPSGELRRVTKEGMATIGQVSNTDHGNVRVGKAGRVRLMGIRPTVRGKAMNPVDHPHGGGEGRNPIGLKYPKTPWGKHALGVKTRKKHKDSDKFILQRRKKR